MHYKLLSATVGRGKDSLTPERREARGKKRSDCRDRAGDGGGREAREIDKHLPPPLK